MEIFLQQIINGLVQGSVYALVALGYTMVYGILGLINFAHGEVVMIGAMLALSSLTALLGWGVTPLLALPLSIALAMLGCMVLGYGIERIAYRPLRHAPRLAPLITAIGVSIVLQNLAMMIWGREYHSRARDARSGREPACGATDGRGHQPRDLDHLHARLGTRRNSRSHGQRQLWFGALLHGFHTRSESLHRCGAGWHRQSARRDAGRIAARADREPGRGLYRRSERRIFRQQLSGCVRLLRADR